MIHYTIIHNYFVVKEQEIIKILLTLNRVPENVFFFLFIRILVKSFNLCFFEHDFKKQLKINLSINYQTT